VNEAVIIDVVRSPMAKGKLGGAFFGLHPVELLAQTIEALVGRTGIDPAIVDDVIVGCVQQVGEQSGTVGRQAWLAAGYPEHVPSTTIDRKCGSSQQAAHFGAQGVMAGAYDVVVVAGVESMSTIPLGLAPLGRDPFGPSVNRRYAPGLVSQGIGAELMAAKWGLDRLTLDEYAAESHARAYAAATSGGFDREIVPIAVETADGKTIVSTDETIRPTTTVEALAKLQPAFEDPEMAARFPQITWSIHAGNSSQITDGAAAMLVTSEARARELGLTPRARFHAFAIAGDDPLMMLTAPIPATRKLLERSGMTVDQMDQVEVNEAFAPVPLAWRQHFDADLSKLNPRGGAIALGHPLGASGARLMGSMLVGLEQSGGRWGFQTMCEAGGMANATIIERV
jgi:acetyl-CoA acyltransferase